MIRNRTQLANAIRGHAAGFGLTAAKGMTHLVPLLDRIQADESLPSLARELFALQAKQYIQLQTEITEVEAKLTAWHRADECSQRLAKTPGIGPIGAALLTMKTGPSTDWGDHVESDEIGRICCRLGSAGRIGRCVWLGRGLTVSLEVSRW
jgi:transposase